MINDPKHIRLPKKDLKDFRVSFDIMVRHDIGSLRHWKEHPAVLAMVAMLDVKDIVELFAEVIENEPGVEVEMIKLRHQMSLATDPSFDAETRQKARDKIKDYLELGLFYDCGNKPYQLYYIYAYRYFGVNLNQPVDVSPDHPSYPLLFAFRLSKTYYPEEFLQHHLSNTFQGDISAYRLLLARLDKAILGPLNDFLSEWIALKLKFPMSKPRKKVLIPKTKASMADYFSDPSKAKSILLDFCGKSKVRIDLAAVTFKTVVKNKFDKNIKAPALCILFIEIGILLVDDSEKYSQRFRRLTIDADPKLLKDLLAVV